MNLEVTLSSSVDGPLSERVVDNNVVVVVCISWILKGTSGLMILLLLYWMELEQEVVNYVVVVDLEVS